MATNKTRLVRTSEIVEEMDLLRTRMDNLEDMLSRVYERFEEFDRAIKRIVDCMKNGKQDGAAGTDLSEM